MALSPNAAALEAQILAVQTAIKRPFDSDPVANLAAVDFLSNYMASHGTTDIRNLRQYIDLSANLMFFYDIATAYVYPNANYNTTISVDGNAATPAELVQASFFCEFEGAQADYQINLIFTKDGYPVFFGLRTDRVSGWSSLVHGVLFLAGAVAGAAFPALGATIGQAVLGASLAAQYPLLASTIGNVCINTVLSGGNVQAAVTGAVAGGIGGETGIFVATQTDSQIIGRIAGSVTRAAISGGNVQGAAFQSLASAGLSSVAQLPSFSGSSNVAQLGDDTSDFSDDTSGSTDNSYLYSDAGYGDTSGQVVDTSDITDQTYHDTVWSSSAANPSEGDPVTLSNPATTPASGVNSVIASANGNSLTALAAAALPLISAYVKAGSPGILTSNSSVTANPNGTLRNANGTLSIMPIGTPYLTSAGLVTNNGNGTYSTIGPTGTVTTTPYPPGTPGVGVTGTLANLSPTVLLAIGAALFLMLR